MHRCSCVSLPAVGRKTCCLKCGVFLCGRRQKIKHIGRNLLFSVFGWKEGAEQRTRTLTSAQANWAFLDWMEAWVKVKGTEDNTGEVLQNVTRRVFTRMFPNPNRNLSIHRWTLGLLSGRYKDLNKRPFSFCFFYTHDKDLEFNNSR